MTLTVRNVIRSRRNRTGGKDHIVQCKNHVYQAVGGNVTWFHMRRRQVHGACLKTFITPRRGIGFGSNKQQMCRGHVAWDLRFVVIPFHAMKTLTEWVYKFLISIDDLALGNPLLDHPRKEMAGRFVGNIR